MSDAVQCPASGCDFEGNGNQSVSTHWRWKHDGPCPLTKATSVCNTCGDAFVYTKSKRTGDYCSNECKFKGRRADIDVGKLRVAYAEEDTIRATADRIGHPYNTTRNALLRHGIVGPGDIRPHAGSVDVTCDGCGDQFTKKHSLYVRSEKHYCSRQCRHRSLAERRESVPCHTCGATLERIPSRVERSAHHFCDQNCRDAWYASESGPCTKPPSEWRTNRWDLDRRVSVAVYLYLKHGKVLSSIWRVVPFSPDKLRSHLRSLFTDGMSWTNYGDWHVDHIVPKSKFNYSKPSHPDFGRAWALSNLQPLWAEDNWKKHSTLSRPLQPTLALEVSR